MKIKSFVSFKIYFGLIALLFWNNSQAQLTAITWDSVTVKSSLVSCGFLDVIDINNDSKLEIVLSTLMEQGSAANQATTKGAVRIFNGTASTGIPTTWNESIVLPTDSNLPFINTPQVYDVDEDGNLDILVQQGFLQTNGGSHQWLKGPNFTQMFAFTPETKKGASNFFWHESCQWDLDGDGKKDIITTCANNTVTPVAKKIEWYRHSGNGQFTKYTICDSLGGVFIKLYDIDGDQDMDIVVSQFFGPPAKPSIVWLEQLAKPSASNSWLGQWAYHKIDHTTGLGYHMEFFDINGDGNVELVYGNHNNLNNTSIVDGNGNAIQSGLYYFDIPANPAASTQWTKHLIAENFPCDLFDFGNPASQGSPGIWSHGDIDNNGFIDIVMPGDGKSGLYLVRQKPDHSFVTEKIAGGKMWGMAKIMDYDNNGVNEIVASLHNFPNNLFDALLGMPAGKLMIYKPANITPTGMIGVSEFDVFSIYPNPSTGIFSVNTFKNEGNINLSVVDIMGKTIYCESFNQGTESISIDISSHPAGTYFIKITDGKNTKTERLVKF